MRRLLAIFAGAATCVAGFSACNLELTPYVDPIDGAVQRPDAGGGEASIPFDAEVPDSATTPPADAAVTPPKKRIFVTSALVTGAFNGQVGADQQCQRLAGEAKLPGTFLAWVSLNNAPAITRIVDVGPWYLVDRDALVFLNRAAMLVQPETIIDRDEKGAQVAGDALVWTGTQDNGTAFIQNCNNFTVQAGQGLAGALSNRKVWTQAAAPDCNKPLRLYCIEQ